MTSTLDRPSSPPLPPPSRSAPPAPAPVPPADGADLCRLTVLGAEGRLDLAVPLSATPGTLLPLIVRRLGGDAAPAAGWVLQRLGEPALDVDTRIDVLDLLDGDVLHLRPAHDPMPELRYDDVPDGIAAALAPGTRRWSPEASARLLRAMAGLGLLASGVLVLLGLPGVAVSPVLWGIGALLVGGAVALGRVARHPEPARVAGLGGVGFAVVAGLWFTGGFLTEAPGVLLAALGAALAAGVLIVAGRVAPVTFGVVAGLAVLVAAVVGVGGMLGVGPDHAVVAVSVTVFVLGSIGPRIAVRLARLRAPLLPRTAPELQDDIEPIDESVVAERTVLADRYLTVLTLCTAALVAATGPALLGTTEWIGWVLPTMVGIATLLRARILESVPQRGALTWAGALTLVVVGIGLATRVPLGGAIAYLAVALLATAGLLVAAWRLPGKRLLPVWGYAGDIAELWSALLLVPLLLQLFGVYAMVRGMNG